MSISRLLAIVTVACVCAITVGAKETPADVARPLLKLAAGKALFVASSDSHFKLLLEFKVHGSGSVAFNGSSSWIVTPSGNFRKETRMSDYDDLQVLKGSILWAKRSLDFMPLQVAWFEYAMSSFRLLDPNLPVERISKGSSRHTSVQCVEVMLGTNPRQLCIDADGNLRKVELPDLKLVYEYSDFRPVGSRVAPYRTTAKRDGVTVLEANVTSLTLATSEDENLIQVPQNAKQTLGCLAPSLPIVTKSVRPAYPQEARRGLQQGDVVLYVQIASDGALTQRSIVQTGGKALDDAALAVIPQWKYEPAKCQGTPVASEALIPVSFTLEIR